MPSLGLTQRVPRREVSDLRALPNGRPREPAAAPPLPSLSTSGRRSSEQWPIEVK